MKNLDLTVSNWWERLSEDERELLITLLYNLQLSNYVEIDKEGNYNKLITEK